MKTKIDHPPTHARRQIVLHGITTRGSFIWTCSHCYWRYPVGPEEDPVASIEAMEAYGKHICSAYQPRKAAA